MSEWIAKYWVEWAFGIVAGVLLWLYRRMASRLKQNREENEALRNGMRALLMRQIAEDCEEARRKGFCTVEKKKIINDMYTSYHALGGNDVITSMKNDMMRLPTEPQDAAKTQRVTAEMAVPDDSNRGTVRKGERWTSG